MKKNLINVRILSLSICLITIILSCSNNNSVTTNYNFVSPDENEKIIDNVVLKHLTNSVNYNPKFESSRDFEKEEALRNISKEILGYLNKEQLDSIIQLKDRLKTEDYLINKIHDYILSIENEIGTRVDDKQITENYTKIDPKIQPKFTYKELRESYDSDSQKYVQSEEIKKNGWSLAKYILNNQYLDFNHGKISITDRNTNQKIEFQKTFLGNIYGEYHKKSSNGEILETTNHKLILKSIYSQGEGAYIKIGSITHGDFFSKLERRIEDGLEMDHGSYRDIRKTISVEAKDPKLTPNGYVSTNRYYLGDNFFKKITNSKTSYVKGYYHNNKLHGKLTVKENLYKLKTGIRKGRWYWDREYIEDTIPTVINFNEGKLEGKVIEYDLVTVKVSKRQYSRPETHIRKKVYSGYSNYKNGNLHGKKTFLKWSDDSNPIKSIYYLSEEFFEKGVKIGEHKSYNGTNFYNPSTDKLNVDNVDVYTETNYKVFLNDPELIKNERDSLKYFGLENGSHKSFMKNISFYLISSYDEFYSPNKMLEGYFKKGISPKKRRYYRSEDIEDRNALALLNGNLYSKATYYKGQLNEKSKVYIEITDILNTYTDLDLNLKIGDTILINEVHYKKEEDKYSGFKINKQMSSFVKTNLPIENFFNKSRKWTYSPYEVALFGVGNYNRYGNKIWSISSIRKITNYSYEKDNPRYNDVESSKQYFYPTNKLISDYKSSQDYIIYNYDGTVLESCCK